MSAHANPNIITDGLVFGYDTGYNINERNLGVGRHFKGPISDNLLEVHNHSRSNTDGANGFVLNGEETVNIPKIGKRSVKYVEYYNNYNNTGDLGCCPNLFYYHSGYITGVESSTSYTYSIIYKHTGNYTHPNFMYRYEYQTDGTYNTEGGIHSTASSRRRHLGNGWYHAWGTFTTQSTTTQLRCYSFLYNYGTTKHRFYVASISLIKNISGSTHLITPPQLMLKPNTSISSTQSLVDLARTTTIDVSNASFDSNAQMTFDGTDDYVTISDSTLFDFGTENFSMEAVVKGTNTDSYRTVFYHHYNPGFVYITNITTGVMRVWIHSKVLNGATNILDGNYHHTALVRQGDTLSLYVDGELDASSTGWSSKNATNTSKGASIGRYIDGSTAYPWNGEILSLKAYNKALTAAEVLQNYNAIKSRFQL